MPSAIEKNAEARAVITMVGRDLEFARYVFYGEHVQRSAVRATRRDAVPLEDTRSPRSNPGLSERAANCFSLSNHDLKEAIAFLGNVPSGVRVNRRFVDRHKRPVLGVQMSRRAGTRQRGQP
jgi:hypothetical protein